MSKCSYCDREIKLIAKGLCNRCYGYFYKRELPIEEELVNSYKPIFKVIDCMHKRPLLKKEVSILINGVNDGLLTKLPHGFWTGVHSYNNATLALDYWLIDVLKCNLSDIPKLDIKEVLKGSPISTLGSNDIFKYKDLVYGLYTIENYIAV